MVTDQPIDPSMEPPLEPEGRSAYVPPVVDESRELNLGWQDVVFGLLTLPLLFFALQYAVSGSEKLIATPGARLRMYLVLLVVELALAGTIVFVVTR